MPKPLRIFCWSLIFFASPLWSQRNCGTEKLDSIRRIKNINLETKADFEKWMGNQLQKKSSISNRTQSTYTIPVVVHIIHNGQAVGTGMNISDAQVLSQINVLNKDFQRLNADASQTPAVFQPVAGSLSVEFVLAKQDPQGNATTGIVRVNGGRSSWNLYQDAELKSKSYWPAEQYFNVWVTNFNGYLGYAQFPVSNLPGVDNSSQDRLTDGVIIHYQMFGSEDDGSFDLDPQFNKGRTLTHEAGHFFGLRHIWGDVSSCAGNGDYVNDTPPQSESTGGCPSHPRTQCSNAVMFQNYMDYTDDRCMNLFTLGQVARFETVLQNSPRRASLLTSPGASPPGNFSTDLGIVNAIAPTTLECSGVHTPSLTIRNYGTTTISSASIEMKINGLTVQTINPTLNLNSLEETTVSFSNYTSAPNETRSFEFSILSVNTTTDQHADNNILTVNSKTAAQASLPYTETFESTLNNWNVLNPDGLIGWQQKNLSGGQGKALFIDLYNYENEGSVDKIYSPRLDISSAPGLLLKFKYAHAHEPSYDGDALYVYAQTGCADDLSNATLVFSKEGESLATVTTSMVDFTPAASHWKTQYLSLHSFVGNPAIRLAFVSRNGFGNNIFIDSVQLIGNNINDIVLADVLEPAPAVCVESITPKLLIRNEGTITINGFSVNVYRGINLLNTLFFSETLLTGLETVVTLDPIALGDGINALSFSVTPNNIADDLPSNNLLDFNIKKIANQQSIPVREDFESSDWHFVSNGDVYWNTLQTNFDNSVFFGAYNFNAIGESAWLVSPRLNLTKVEEAAMFVDFSYGKNLPSDEFVSVKVSENCGETFAHVLLDDFASTFASEESSDAWIPESNSDWQTRYFNLNSFAGQDDILVAIEVVNDKGNNFFVDNIEFFENDDPTPTRITEPYRVYSNTALTQTYLTFNLDEPQPAQVMVSSTMGASLVNIPVDNALNQTLTFQLNVAPGIYIFHVRIGDKWSAVKQYIGY